MHLFPPPGLWPFEGEQGSFITNIQPGHFAIVKENHEALGVFISYSGQFLLGSSADQRAALPAPTAGAGRGAGREPGCSGKTKEPPRLHPGRRVHPAQASQSQLGQARRPRASLSCLRVVGAPGVGAGVGVTWCWARPRLLLPTSCQLTCVRCQQETSVWEPQSIHLL